MSQKLRMAFSFSSASFANELFSHGRAAKWMLVFAHERRKYTDKHEYAAPILGDRRTEGLNYMLG